MQSRRCSNQAASQPPKYLVVGGWRAELLPRRHYETAHTPDAAVVGFAFESQAGVHAFAGDRRADFRARANSLAYVPAGCDVFSRSDHGGEYLTIKVAQESGDRPPSERRFNDVVDPAAIDAAQRLRCILLAGNPVEPLLFERLVRVLQGRVLRILGGTSVESRTSAWMTARRLRLVDETIEAKLDAKLTVQELAQTLGLSAGFFSRAFKAAVGKAPHDYIIDRRISRARALLQSSKLGLSAIALASGFASHAHMTAVFRSRLGTTPSELRKTFV